MVVLLVLLSFRVLVLILLDGGLGDELLKDKIITLLFGGALSL
jgi:hypothetical protein